MSAVKIMLRDNNPNFQPGETLDGAAAWDLPNAPKHLEVRLLYFTKGKGQVDVVVVDRFNFDNPLSAEARRFNFRLPDSPYSFAGSLITLVWAVEAVAEPFKDFARMEFVMSPTRQAVKLGDAGPPPSS